MSRGRKAWGMHSRCNDDVYTGSGAPGSGSTAMESSYSKVTNIQNELGLTIRITL